MVSHTEAVAVAGLHNAVPGKGVAPIGQDVGLNENLRADLDYVPAVDIDFLYPPGQVFAVCRTDFQSLADESGPFQDGAPESVRGAHEVRNLQLSSHPSGETGGHDADLEDGGRRPLCACCQKVEEPGPVSVEIQAIAARDCKALPVPSLEGNIYLVQVSPGDFLYGFRREESAVGSQSHREFKRPRVVKDLKELGMKEGLAHYMKCDLFGQVELRNLVEGRLGQTFIHHASLARHLCVGAKHARKIAPVGQFQMNAFEFAWKISRQ